MEAYRMSHHRLGLLLMLCAIGSNIQATERLDIAPQPDQDTLLYMPFNEPDEAVMIGENLAIDPIYSHMVADYRQGRFDGALRFVGQPGLSQCMLIPFPQKLYMARDVSRKDPNKFADRLVPNVIIDNHRGYTIECWIYPQVLKHQTVIAALNTAAYVPKPAWQIDLTDESKIRFACGSGLARFEMVSTRQVPIGQWSHIAVVCQKCEDKKQMKKKGGDIQIFINGSPASDIAWMERATLQRNYDPGSDGTTLCIGGPDPDAQNGFYDGLIDELRISKIARSFEHDSAVMIESRKELFLDDTLIGKMTGVKRVVNHPQRYKNNPLLKSQGLWDEKHVQPMGIVWDDRLKLFRCWYRGFDRTGGNACNCYAFSRDGLHWEQPSLGLVEYNGSTDNNIVRAHCNGFYFIDPLARPGQPYICMTTKLSYGGERHGPFKQILVRSADGLHWNWGKVETMSGYAGRPYDRIRRIQSIMAVDRPLMTFPQYYAKIDKLVKVGKEGEADQMKPFMWSRVGWDLLHWQDPVKTGLKMTEKNNQAWYSFQCWDMGNVMIGITGAYHGQRPGRWIDMQLAVSRDSYHWQHVADQETFFGLGTEGTWDDGMINKPRLIDLPGEDKYYIYYMGSSVHHDMSDDADPKDFPIYNMGVAFLRKDGFVSLEPDGSADTAVVETNPIRFTGSRLYVNADAAGGSVQVELADVNGNPISGLAKTNAQPLRTDNLRHIVQWSGNPDVSQLEEKSVIVRFYLTGGAKLYSYRFGPADPHQ